MKIHMIALAAGLVVALSGSSAFAQQATCNGTDKLVKLKTGEHRCWDVNRLQQLPEGATVVNKQTPTAAPKQHAPSKTGSTIASFAATAEQCLKDKGLLSTTSAEKGCFVGVDGKFHCTHNDDAIIAVVSACKTVANDKERPQRWNAAVKN